MFGFNSSGGFNFDFSWGNTVGALRWNHVFSPKLFVNTTASFTRYQYEVANRLDEFSFRLASDIRDVALRTDFEYQPNEKHTLKFGASATNHVFGVGRLQAGSEDGRLGFGSDVNYKGQEGALYASDNFKPMREASAGVRPARYWLPERLRQLRRPGASGGGALLAHA